jgi:hypothetical protein
VVAVGDTAMLPFVGCVPIPLSIVTLVAFVVDQVSVELCPALMLVGLAEKLTVGAGVEPLTVTVAVAVVVPPAPVAVNVYVVVAVGVTVTAPEAETVPMPLSIVTVLALVVFQVRVELWPEVMVVGLAEKVAVGAGVEPFTVTVVFAVVVPPGPVAVRV